MDPNFRLSPSGDIKLKPVSVKPDALCEYCMLLTYNG